MRWSTRFVAALLLGVLLASCSEDVHEEVTGEAVRSPDEVFTDFVTMESDCGRVQWRLRAPRANRYTKEKLILLDNPIIEFFDKEGMLQTTLESDAGEYSEATRDMLAFGNVVVIAVFGNYQRQGDVAASVQGPALGDGEAEQVHLFALQHHFLAGGAAHRLGLI